MSDKATQGPSTSLIDTASELLVGAGILIMALFPLAVPMIALLILAALPLLALAVAASALGAVLVMPVVLVRGLSRKLSAVPRNPRQDHRVPGNRPAMGARG
jgi:membrane protein implicated in regulation of membrane protease activity